MSRVEGGITVKVQYSYQYIYKKFYPPPVLPVTVQYSYQYRKDLTGLVGGSTSPHLHTVPDRIGRIPVILGG